MISSCLDKQVYHPPVRGTPPAKRLLWLSEPESGEVAVVPEYVASLTLMETWQLRTVVLPALGQVAPAAHVSSIGVHTTVPVDPRVAVPWPAPCATRYVEVPHSIGTMHPSRNVELVGRGRQDPESQHACVC